METRTRPQGLEVVQGSSGRVLAVEEVVGRPGVAEIADRPGVAAFDIRAS